MSRILVLGALLALMVAGCTTPPQSASGISSPFSILSIETMNNGAVKISAVGQTYCTDDKELGDKAIQMYKQTPFALYQADWHRGAENDSEIVSMSSTKCGGHPEYIRILDALRLISGASSTDTR